MYLWKCWRDTRAFFLVVLIINATVMPVAAVVTTGTGLMKDFGTQAFTTTFATMSLVLSLLLGAITASEEFTPNTIHFLFTKPRSRRYFVWAGWVVGCSEFLTIALVNLLSGWITLIHYGKQSSALDIGQVAPQAIVGTAVLGLFIYCLSYSLAALLRSGLKGVAATMAIIFGSEGFSIAIRLRWHVNVPIPTMPIGGLAPTISNMVWALIALSFVLAAQLAIEGTQF